MIYPVAKLETVPKWPKIPPTVEQEKAAMRAQPLPEQVTVLSDKRLSPEEIIAESEKVKALDTLRAARDSTRGSQLESPTVTAVLEPVVQPWELPPPPKSFEAVKPPSPVARVVSAGKSAVSWISRIRVVHKP